MAKKAMPEEEEVPAPVQMKIRVPDELRYHLETAVKKSGRSLNSEIVWRLEQSFKAEYDDLRKDVAELKAWMEEQRRKKR